MATKKQHEQFNKSVEKYLISIGGNKVDTQCFGFRYKLNTLAGELFVSCHEAENSEVFSVYCRFEQPERAKEVLSKWEQDRLNPYSGKWNYHQRNASYLLNGLKANLSDLITN